MSDIKDLLKPRYKVISDYPDSCFYVGEILEAGTKDLTEATTYPHIFEKMEWWEQRTIEQLKAIKYVKVVNYKAYWLVGDIVPVIEFEGGSIDRAKPTGYYLSENRNHFHAVFDILPATEAEYNSIKLKQHP